MTVEKKYGVNNKGRTANLSFFIVDRFLGGNGLAQCTQLSLISKDFSVLNTLHVDKCSPGEDGFFIHQVVK
jgi:hypothetical protein